MSIFNHKEKIDERGKLVVLESCFDVPFNFKRVFYIYGVQKKVSRGQHAHYKTKQYLIAINGSCRIRLNDGINETSYKLCKPNVGIFQDALVWGTMYDFSPDCVLLVLASDHYDESDYISSFTKFMETVKV